MDRQKGTNGQEGTTDVSGLRLETKNVACVENGIYIACQDCIYSRNKEACKDSVKLSSEKTIAITELKVGKFLEHYGFRKKDKDLVLMVMELFFNNKGIEFCEKEGGRIMIRHTTEDGLTTNEEVMLAVMDFIDKLRKVIE